MNDTTFCVNALSDLLYPHLQKTEDFSEHVTFCGDVGRRLIRWAVLKNLARFEEELFAQVPKTWELVDFKGRTLITLIGVITYKRRVYKDEYGSRRYPLDEALGIPPLVRIEPRAFLWIVNMAANMSFAKTARAFNERSGCHITKTSVMRCVHKEGDMLAEQPGAKPGDIPISTPVLFSEFDGFHIHLQSDKKQLPALPRTTYKAQFKKKSKEIKVWVAYAGKEDDRRLYPFHWASDAPPDEFFSECLGRTSFAYDIADLEYVVSGSDAAGWCKTNELDVLLPEHVKAVSKLDVYHINQRVYKAFTDEEDRSVFLKFLYSKDFDGFFECLGRRIDDEPEHERIAHRQDLFTYIQNNLDWLSGPSLTSSMRTRLLAALDTVFEGRAHHGFLRGLLEKRRYKKFVCVLERITSRCMEASRGIYQAFLADVRDTIATIRLYSPVRLGTIEGTNSKVYASRLKVWGCAWSERGGLAMMRIRAALASGVALIAPSYDAWLTDKEKDRIDKWRHRSLRIPESAGKGYEPPQGSVFAAKGLTPDLYGLVRM